MCRCDNRNCSFIAVRKEELGSDRSQTNQELIMSHEVTPEAVLCYESPTEGYLCPLSANTAGIEFLKFEVRDYDTQVVVYQVGMNQHTLNGVPPSGCTRRKQHAHNNA